MTVDKIVLSLALLSAGQLASAATTPIQNCNASGCRAGAQVSVTTSYAQTKYPIVLAHGDAGWNDIGGYQYFYGIPQDLAANGASVYVPLTAALNSSEVRGEQLLTQVRQILAISGKTKVNLISHSHGAQSIRYVAGIIPAQVASVTTVGGPNKGSPLADTTVALLHSTIGSAITPLFAPAINAFFSLIGVASGHYYDLDTLADLSSLTTGSTAAFNTRFPAGVPLTACGEGAYQANGVRFYSWGGAGTLTNPFDPSDALLGLTATMISGASDGLVQPCSSHLGQVIRDNYPQNHLDEVNQFFGLVYVFGASPVTLYRQHANRLKLAGI